MVEMICGKGEFWAWNETVSMMDGDSGEQVGGELESVTSSAGCFMQGWRNEPQRRYKILRRTTQRGR